MSGKGSRRRPEDADAIARRWPFRKPAAKPQAPRHRRDQPKGKGKVAV